MPTRFIRGRNSPSDFRPAALVFLIAPIVIFSHVLAREGILRDDTPEAPAYARHSPLAAQSLLIAVERSGDRFIAVGERGHILHGEGDGQWHQAVVPARILLTGVSFSDRQHGLAVGHDAVILATADGGRRWRKVHEAIHEQRPLLDVRLRRDGTGIAIGAYGYLLRTRDGGETWRAGSVDPEHDFHLNAIALAPGAPEKQPTASRAAIRGIYIAAEAGRVYRSDDGGENWRTLKPPYDGSFFGVHVMEGEGRDRVMVFGLRGHLFVSEDAGEHWRAIATGTRASLTAAITLGTGQLLFTGHAGTLLLADSDLRNIRSAQLPERKALSDAVEVAPNRVLVVGEAGARMVELDRVFDRAICKSPACTLQLR